MMTGALDSASDDASLTRSRNPGGSEGGVQQTDMVGDEGAVVEWG